MCRPYMNKCDQKKKNRELYLNLSSNETSTMLLLNGKHSV